MRPEAIATMIRAAATRMMRLARGLHRARRGTAALEFAIAGPVLLMLIFAVIENGLMLFAQSVIENATRDAARQVMIGNINVKVDVTTGIANFRAALCNDVGTFLDCTKLQFYVKAGITFPSAVIVPNSTGSFGTTTFVPGTAGQFVLVEVAYDRVYISPWLVGIVPNGWLLFATQAIQNEPFS